MSKILRKSALIFGQSSGFQQMGQFGSLANGGPAYSTDPAVIQALSQWVDGWFAAVLGNNSPAIEDVNAFCYVVAYQIAYGFQAGVPEWDAGTTYFKGSLAQDGTGVLYVSITDNNLNNALTVTADWKILNKGLRTVTGTDTVGVNDDIILLNASGGAFTETLPAVASSLGRTLIFKDINYTNVNRPTLQGNASENIQSLLVGNTYLFQRPGDCLTLYCDGTQWQVIAGAVPQNAIWTGNLYLTGGSYLVPSGTSFQDPSVTPASPGQVASAETINLGMGTVTFALDGNGNPLPQITFTPKTFGAYEISVNTSGETTTGSSNGYFQLTDGGATTQYDYYEFGTSGGSSEIFGVRLVGIVNATSLSPITMKLQAASSGAGFEFFPSQPGTIISFFWTIKKIG